MTPNTLLTLRNAIENASTAPVSDAEIVAMLRGEGGSGAQLRALFEDSTFQALARAARAFDIPRDTLLAAYAAARTSATASNPELDEALKQEW